ncbi:MAG: coiled-coil domain-containing protein, partial [Christensenellales bacterium]
QTFRSSKFSLSSDSYYMLSFYVMTDYIKNDLNTNYGARFTISSDTTTIFDLYNIKFDDNNWHKVDVKIKTGTNSQEATIALTFDKLIGYVFFDKIELQTINETTYNDTTLENANITPYRIDLTYENFDNKTFGKNVTTSGIDTPNNWKFVLENEEVGVHSGIIQSNNSLLVETPPSLSGNKTYLYISSTHDGNFYYTSKEEYTFNSETYYKISINVLTRNLENDEIDEDVDEDTPYGASISLSNSDNILIKGINTNGVWKTYTIYASFTESLTTPIRLSLGYTDVTCMGEVLFDNLTITTMEPEEYNASIESAELGTYATFTDYTAPVDEDKEEAEPWKNTFNWLIIPSLVTGIAIIIAIVGYYVKKINLKRKPKIKTNYDRRKTLDKDIDKREKIALRKQIIEELKSELESIDKEIEDFNVIANEKLEEIKVQIVSEQEELKKQKLEIEIRKKEATAEREKQLKASPDFVSNTKAEKEYNNFITKLDRQEMAIQKKISDREFKLATAKELNNEKLNKYTARQEYIRLQIAKIEAEIEEIARQEDEMWAEYKAAKADAKRRKAEYKAQLKAEKDKKASNRKTANTTKSTTSKTSKPTKKSTAKSLEENVTNSNSEVSNNSNEK